MAGGYTVGIASDTKAFKQGVDTGVINPLEDAKQAVDDLGKTHGPDELRSDLERAGDAVDDLGKSHGPRDLKDDLERVGQAGKDAGGKLEQSMRDAQDETRDAQSELDELRRKLGQAGRAARDAGDDGERGLGKLGDKGAEVGEELRGNLGETFSSFRGDLEDLPQIAQDTLGGLAGSGALGGIPGLVATAAGAAGLGLLIGVFDNLKQHQEELQEATKQWAQQYMESGGQVIDEATQVSNVQDILANKYDTVKKNADNWGVSISTAALAMAGNVGAIQQVSDSVDDQRQKFEDAQKAAGGMTDAYGNLNGDLVLQQKGLTDGTTALRELNDTMSKGKGMAAGISGALYTLALQSGKATGQVDKLGNQIYKLPDDTDVVVNAKTGQASKDLHAFDQTKKAATRDETVKVYADLSPFERTVAQMRNTGLKPIRLNVDATVTYRDRGGKVLQ